MTTANNSNKDESNVMKDVLDAALDELEDDTEWESSNSSKQEVTTIPFATSSTNSLQSTPGAATTATEAVHATQVGSNGVSQTPDTSPEMMEEMMKLEQMMKQLFQLPPGGGNVNDDDVDDEESRRMLHEMQRFMAHFESQTNNASAAQQQPPQQSKQEPSFQQPIPPPSPSVSESDVSRTISSLLDDMAKTASHNNDEDDPHQTLPNVDEQQFLQGMMKELEGFSGGFDADHVIDGMMEQLVSKDIMYEPLRQVTAKFPKWLADHKKTLPDNEYQERCRQYACFQKLVNVYETDPNNLKELMSLMQDVQEFGQPPPEIIHEIAPGLELDEHGVPKMNGMTGGGLPFGGSEECLIM